MVSQNKLFSFNPFMPNELFYPNSLDRSISNRRDVGLVYIITMFYRNFCFLVQNV